MAVLWHLISPLQRSSRFWTFGLTHLNQVSKISSGLSTKYSNHPTTDSRPHPLNHKYPALHSAACSSSKTSPTKRPCSNRQPRTAGTSINRDYNGLCHVGAPPHFHPVPIHLPPAKVTVVFPSRVRWRLTVRRHRACHCVDRWCILPPQDIGLRSRYGVVCRPDIGLNWAHSWTGYFWS